MNPLSMLARLDLRGFTGDLGAAIARPEAQLDDAAAVDSVRTIVAEVRTRGDAALRELTARLDGATLEDLSVPREDMQAALRACDPELRAALEYAAAEIRVLHEAQGAASGDQAALDLDRRGVRVREMLVPVDRAGCYAPGGRADYPSTVLMTAIPARVAGVREVILCVPPRPDGRVPAVTLAAAALAEVDTVFRIGGAQAIAAMAYGTESVPRVDVVVGPGNRYVALAKREVAGVVGIESLAGPSELVVIADAHADARLVAADLLAQAEHGPDGAAVLVTWDEGVADAVDAAARDLVTRAPRAAEIEATLASGGRAILVDGPAPALAVANEIAPEHLELVTRDPESLVAGVRNAGAVFCGPWAPAVIGDYVAGTNHVLPTGGTARFASGLRVDDFRKHVSVVDVDEAALRRVAPAVRALAAVEGLPAHGDAVARREALGEHVPSEQT